MLWATIGGLVLLIAGLLVVWKTERTIIGIVLAILGAGVAIGMFGAVQHLDAKNSAKCASIDGSYGGDTCYVEGVEKDLKEIGL